MTMEQTTKWVAFAKRQMFADHEKTTDAKLRQRIRDLMSQLEGVEQECREISQHQNAQQHEQRIEK